jgi:chromosome segregation ATPase
MTEDEIRRLGTILDEKLSGLESRVDEKLAGFGTRFDRVDQHLAQVDQHLEKVDQHLEKVDPRFEKIDARFDQVDRRIDDLHRHLDLVAESLNGQIQQMAEGVVVANERLDRFEQRTTAEFGEVKSMIRLSYAELERRLGTLEATVLDLAHRVETLERHSPQ